MDNLAELVADAAALGDETRGKDMVALLGGAGSGKTTLTYMLLGRPLKLKHTSVGRVPMPVTPLADLVVSERAEAGATRVTLKPLANGLHVCDLPGQRDAGGLLKEIKFTVMTARALRQAASVRVLVCWPKELFTADREPEMMKLLTDLHRMFRDWNAVKGSVCFCFSKFLDKNEMEESMAYEEHLRVVLSVVSKLRDTCKAEREGNVGFDVLETMIKALEDAAVEASMLDPYGPDPAIVARTRAIASNPLDAALYPLLQKIVSALPTLPSDAFTLRLSTEGAATLLEHLRKVRVEATEQFDRGDAEGAAKLLGDVMAIATIVEKEQLVLAKELNEIVNGLHETLMAKNSSFEQSLYEVITSLAIVNAESDLGVKMQRMCEMDEFIEKVRRNPVVTERALFTAWASKSSVLLRVTTNMNSDLSVVGVGTGVVPDIAVVRAAAGKWSRVATALRDFDAGTLVGAVRQHLTTLGERIAKLCDALTLAQPVGESTLASLVSPVGAEAVAQLAPMVHELRRIAGECQGVFPMEVLAETLSRLKARTQQQLTVLRRQCEEVLSEKALVSQGCEERRLASLKLQLIVELCQNSHVQEWAHMSGDALRDEFVGPLVKIADAIANYNGCGGDEIDELSFLDDAYVAEQLRVKLNMFETYAQSGDPLFRERFDQHKRAVLGQLNAELKRVHDDLQVQIRSCNTKFKELAARPAVSLGCADSHDLPDFETAVPATIEWSKIWNLAPTDVVLHRNTCGAIISRLTGKVLTLLADAEKYVQWLVDKRRWANIVAVMNDVLQGVLSSTLELDRWDLGTALRQRCEQYNSELINSSNRLHGMLRSCVQSVKVNEVVVNGSGEWIDAVGQLSVCVSQLKWIPTLAAECDTLRKEISTRVDSWLAALQSSMRESTKQLRSGTVGSADIPKLVNAICDQTLSCIVPFERSVLFRKEKHGSLQTDFEGFVEEFVTQLESPVGLFHNQESRERDVQLLMTLHQRLAKADLLDDGLADRLATVVNKARTSVYGDVEAFKKHLDNREYQQAMQRYHNLKSTITNADGALRLLTNAMESFIYEQLSTTLLGGRMPPTLPATAVATSVLEIIRLTKNDEALNVAAGLKKAVEVALTRIRERAASVEAGLRQAMLQPHPHNELVEEFAVIADVVQIVAAADESLTVPKAAEAVEASANPLLERCVVTQVPYRVLATQAQREEARAWAETTFVAMRDVGDALTRLRAWQSVLDNPLRVSVIVVWRLTDLLKQRLQQLAEAVCEYVPRDEPAVGETWLARVQKLSETLNEPIPCVETVRANLSMTTRKAEGDAQRLLKSSKYKAALEKIRTLPKDAQQPLIDEVTSKIEALLGPVDHTSTELVRRYCELQRFIQDVQDAKCEHLVPELLQHAEESMSVLQGKCEGKKGELLADALTWLGRRDIVSSARSMVVLLPFLRQKQLTEAEGERLTRALEEFWANLTEHAMACLKHAKARQMKQLQLGQLAARARDLSNLQKEELQALGHGVSPPDVAALLKDLVDELNREALNTTFVSRQLEQRNFRAGVEAVALGIEAHRSLSGLDAIVALQPSCEGVLEEFAEKLRKALETAWAQRNWKTVDATLDALRAMAKETAEFTSLSGTTSTCTTRVSEAEAQMRALVTAELRSLTGATSAVMIGGPLLAAWGYARFSATMQRITTEEINKVLRRLKGTLGQRVVDEVGLNLQSQPDEMCRDLVSTFKEHFKGAAGALFAERLQSGQLTPKNV